MGHLHEPRSLADLGAGDHLCCIYETEEEHRALVVPYILQGLDRNEKVVYIVDAHTSEEIIGYLREDGVEVDVYLERGQLAILARDDAYMSGGVFDPDGMIALLRSETDLAVKQGYACLRVTGEMTWALRGLPGSERLMEYEAKLNRFFPGSRALAICQYDRRRFPPEILLDVLSTHPTAVIGTMLYDNIYYIPPEEFLGSGRSASELSSRLRNLEEHQRMGDSLRKRSWELGERIKELNCLYRVAENIEKPDVTLDDILLATVGEVLQAMQDPGTTSVRVTFEGREFTDPGFEETAQLVSAGIWFKGSKAGSIEVFRKQGPPEGEEPFLLPEEQELVEIVAERLGRVAERLWNEAALRESEQKFHGLVEYSPFGTVLIDREGRVTEWNAAQQEITGVPAEEAVGSFLWDLQYRMAEEEARAPGALPRLREMILAGLESGDAPWLNRVEERELVRPGGGRRTYRSVTFPIRTAGGTIFASMGEDVTERKAAEEALAVSERRFRDLVEQSLEGIIILDDRGAIVEWNRAMEEITEIRREDILGRPVWEFMRMMLPRDQAGPGGVDRAAAMVMEGIASRGEEPWFQQRMEREIELDGGRRRTVQTWSFPIHSGDSFMVGTVVRDVTERKAAEEALREAGDYLDSLIEYASAPIVVWDPARRINRFNQAFERLSGYSASEVVGGDLAVLFPPESRDASLAKIALAAGGEYWESVEIPILCRDGETRLVLWNSANVYGEDGSSLLATIAQGIDISGRKAAEEALRESEEKFRSLVEQSLEGFSLTDSEGRIVEWNRAQEEITGLRLEEVRGEYLWDVTSRLLPPALRTPEFLGFMRDSMRKEYEEGGAGGGFTERVEREIFTPQGERRAIQVWNYPIRTLTGLMVGSIVNDVTERVEREKEIRRINADLQAFAHTLSHDLKGPLAVATGYAATLERLLAGRLGATEADTLRETLRSLDKMNSIIEGMLQYASLERPVEMTLEVDLDALVRGILEELPEEWGAGEGFRFEAGFLPVVAGDAARLRQVLTNLVSNAVKFSAGREGALVEVGMEDTLYGPAVCVRDNGPGIRPEDLEHIFEPLARAEGASGLPGHGLGLAIVQRAVESWGGRAWAESQPGRGAAFFFTLPPPAG